MTPLKKVLRNEAVRRLACALGAAYIRLVERSGRWTTMHGETAERLLGEGTPFIVAFWHGRLLLMPSLWRRRARMHMLVSAHPDGRLIARTVGHFGIETVAGSTTRGGAGALRALVQALAAGACVGVTPDGPRGPRMRAGDGVVTIARLSGAPVLPVTYATTRCRVLATWDRFLLAWPFGRGVIVWGEPVRVARDADAAAREAARRRIEDSLNAITAKADALSGRPPVEPAAVAAAAPS